MVFGVSLVGRPVRALNAKLGVRFSNSAGASRRRRFNAARGWLARYVGLCGRTYAS